MHCYRPGTTVIVTGVTVIDPFSPAPEQCSDTAGRPFPAHENSGSVGQR